MNVAAALVMGAAGMAAGWFIPLIAAKAAEYKLKKSGKTLSDDRRFTSPVLKIGCLLINGSLWAAAGMLTTNLLHACLIDIVVLDAAVIILVDIGIRIVPNEAVALMAFSGLILQFSLNGLASLFTSAATMIAVMVVFIALGYLMGLQSVGAGDVKLAGAMGLMLGYPNILYGLAGMSVLILVWCTGGLISRKLTRKSMLAFAPFIMAGTIFAIVANIYSY